MKNRICLTVISSLILTLLAACNPALAPVITSTESQTSATITPEVEIPTAFPTATAFETTAKSPSSPTLLPKGEGSYETQQPPPRRSEPNFRTVQMVDAQSGWAIASLETMQRSHLLRTEDGGKTWRDVTPVYDGVFQSFFLDEQHAWLWDMDRVWRTQDGGNSWTTLDNFGWGPDVWFNDAEHGWKLNAQYWGLSFVQFDIDSFSTTDDGGETWQETTQPSDDGVVLFMAYPTDQVAWTVSAGFAKAIEGVPDLAIPFGIQFTVDRGNTWISREMPLPPEAAREERIYEGAYLGGAGNCNFISPLYSSTTIWKLALTCETQSWIYTTTNQGETWIISSMPAGTDARMQFVDPSNGWLFLGGWSKDFQGNLYRTTDGGESWTLVKRTGWGEMRMSFVDAQTGWAIACSGGYCEGNDEQALVVTRDGGETWEEVKPRLVP